MNTENWKKARIRGSGDADIAHDGQVWVGNMTAEEAVKEFESDGSVFFFWLDEEV